MIKQAPFKPTDIGGCQMWLDGADRTTITGNITSIREKANNVSLSVSGTVTTSTIGSQSSLNFDGTDYLFGNINNILTGTSFVVFKATAANNWYCPFFTWRDNAGQANFPAFGYVPGGNLIGPYTTFVGVGTPTTSVTIGNTYLTSYSWSGTTTNVGFNGATPTSGTQPAFASSETRIWIAYDNGETGNGGYTTVNIGEILLYNSVLGTTQRQQVESYLAQKWGLRQQLPQGHPGTRGIVYPSQPIPTAIYWRYPSQFVPTSIGGCQIWLDAADSATFTLNGSTVSTWIDKTGNGFNVSQATAGSQPTLGSNEVVFNGSTSLQYSGSVGIFGKSYTSYVIHTPTNNTSYLQGIISIKDSTTGFDFEIGQFYAWVSGGSIYHQFTATVNSKTILGINSTTSLGLNYSINGQPLTAGGAGWFSVSAGSLLLIGNSQYSATGFIGTINEYLLFTRTLTATEHNQITGYLAWKWGSQSSLPANHPFKNAAPVGTTNPAGVSRPANVLPIPSIVCTPIRTYFLVTADLMLHVDAGNPASYPGSGSTWFDLTTSGLNVTLYSSPTYSSANGGYIAFTPSSSQYGGTSGTYNGGVALTRWTTEVWHYYTNVTVGNLSAIICSVYAGNVNFALGSPVGGASGKNLAAAYFAGSWYYTSSTYALPSVGWYHIVGTYDGTNLKLYVNNVLTQTQASATTPGFGGGEIRLMRRWDTGDYWGGYLAIARVYKRALSADEVNTNYQVNKARFGLS
jgi:hypothetical protein